MVQLIVDLEERENRVLIIVKGKYGLRTKSEAVSFIIRKFEEKILKPGLRPEHFKKDNNLLFGTKHKP